MSATLFFGWLIQTSTGGMSPLVKEQIQVIQWSVAIIGGLVAAFIAIYQLRASTKQRDSELRWKKASLAREMLNELWSDPYCSDAILMLEWTERYYSLTSGKTDDPLVMINVSEVLSALEKPTKNLDSKERYIRDCFVRFFKMSEVLGHYVRIGLSDIDDLRYPYKAYVRKMGEGGNVYYDFLKFYNFKNALQLFDQVKQLKPLPQQSLEEKVKA